MREERFERTAFPTRLTTGDELGVLLLGHAPARARKDELYLVIGRQLARYRDVFWKSFSSPRSPRRAPRGHLAQLAVRRRPSDEGSDWQKKCGRQLSSDGPAVAYVGLSRGDLRRRRRRGDAEIKAAGVTA